MICFNNCEKRDSKHIIYFNNCRKGNSKHIIYFEKPPSIYLKKLKGDNLYSRDI